MTEYIIVKTEDDYRQASLLFKAYADWLNIDLSFQDFNKELNELKTSYAPADGGIILCKNNNQFNACVAVRRINSDTAELKRMFVQPDFQRRGYGKILLEKAFELAKKCNYSYIRLDTLNYMMPAIKLYKQYGFYEIEPYYHNPHSTALFFERML